MTRTASKALQAYVTIWTFTFRISPMVYFGSANNAQSSLLIYFFKKQVYIRFVSLVILIALSSNSN